MNRAADVAVAGSALVLTSPLLGLAALAVKLGDGGPVLYRQTRVGKDGVDRQRVVAHGAVAQRAAAAGIVRCHAADGGARCRRDVDRKPEAVLSKRAIKLVEYNAGLDHAAPAGHVKLENLLEVLRAIDDKR